MHEWTHATANLLSQHGFNLFWHIWYCFLINNATWSSVPSYYFVTYDIPHFLLLSTTEDHKPFLHTEFSPDLLQCFAIKNSFISCFCTLRNLSFYPMMETDRDTDILYIFFIHKTYYIQTKHSIIVRIELTSLNSFQNSAFS